MREHFEFRPNMYTYECRHGRGFTREINGKYERLYCLKCKPEEQITMSLLLTNQS